MNKKVLMVIWNIAIVVFLGLLVLAPINAAPEGIAFSFHPKEGQVFNQVVDIDFQINLPGNAVLAKIKYLPTFPSNTYLCFTNLTMLDLKL